MGKFFTWAAVYLGHAFGFLVVANALISLSTFTPQGWYVPSLRSLVLLLTFSGAALWAVVMGARARHRDREQKARDLTWFNRGIQFAQQKAAGESQTAPAGSSVSDER